MLRENTAVKLVLSSALIALVAACPGQTNVVNSADRLPVEQRVLLLFKSLTYDRNIAKDRKELRLGVVVASGNAGSEKIGKELIAQVEKIAHLKVRGLKISAVLVPISSGAGAAAALQAKKANVIYTAPGVEEALSSICAYGVSAKNLVVSGETAHAKKCAALAIVKKGSKPKVLLNLSAAKKQGASFDEPLLRIAELVSE